MWAVFPTPSTTRPWAWTWCPAVSTTLCSTCPSTTATSSSSSSSNTRADIQPRATETEESFEKSSSETKTNIFFHRQSKKKLPNKKSLLSVTGTRSANRQKLTRASIKDRLGQDNERRLLQQKDGFLEGCSIWGTQVSVIKYFSKHFCVCEKKPGGEFELTQKDRRWHFCESQSLVSSRNQFPPQPPTRLKLQIELEAKFVQQSADADRCWNLLSVIAICRNWSGSEIPHD